MLPLLGERAGVRAGVPLFELYGSRTPWLLGWAAALVGLALAALPFAASAQGTYLSAPDGNPDRAVVVDDDGNVSIGTASPQTKLDVAGSIRRSGITYPAVWREEVISADRDLETRSFRNSLRITS
jgi:hypothetical protein